MINKRGRKVEGMQYHVLKRVVEYGVKLCGNRSTVGYGIQVRAGSSCLIIDNGKDFLAAREMRVTSLDIAELHFAPIAKDKISHYC